MSDRKADPKMVGFVSEVKGVIPGDHTFSLFGEKPFLVFVLDA